MKIFNAISIDASPSNEDGLALVYFEFENFNYFTICFNEDEQEEIYIEYSEQSSSIYSNDISYVLQSNNVIKFSIGKKISEEIKMDSEFEILFECSEEELENLKQSLIAIFKISK